MPLINRHKVGIGGIGAQDEGLLTPEIVVRVVRTKLGEIGCDRCVRGEGQRIELVLDQP